MKRFRPDVLIGGFHLSGFPADEKLAQMAEALDEYSAVYYTCHCTGTEQYRFMKEHMAGLHYVSTGENIEI